MKFCPQCETGYPDDATACPIHAVMLVEMRDLRPGILIANNYRIFRKLGQGATGSVYLAENALTDQPQALRFLTAELSRDVAFMSRYQRTARKLSQTQQKNIINSGVLETAEDGSLFFAMDFVDGPSLRELMNMAPGPFGVGMSLAIARCIAEGLDAAQSAGIVHRNIKPENILIAREGGALAPKIANFGMGIIKQNGAAFRPSGRTLLTSSYAAPEQWLDAQSAELDGRTDLYALGAILFEMLTGEALFHANDFEGWVLHRLIPVPRRPSDLRPDLATWNGLDRLVLSLLATKPQDRPKDAAEVLRQLDAVQFGIPVPETIAVSVIEAPSPVVEIPAPVVETPAPVLEAPAPVLEIPSPVLEALSPILETPSRVLEAPSPVLEAPAPVVETPPVSLVDVVELETQPPVSLEDDSNAAAELPNSPIPMDTAENADELAAEALKEQSYFGTNDKVEDYEEVFAEVLKQQGYFGSRDKEEETEENIGNAAEALNVFSPGSISADDRVLRTETPEVPSFSGSRDTAEDTGEEPAIVAEPPNFFSRILARGNTRPLPAEIPEVSSFFGSKDALKDTVEKPDNAADPSNFFSRLPARGGTQALRTNTPEPQSFSDHEGAGKDSEEKPSVASEFQDFIRRDPMDGNAQALPRKTPEQPSFSRNLEWRNDILFKPRDTDDLESFFRREYMGPVTEEGHASAAEPPSFSGRADTGKDADRPPKRLRDLPDWLRRVQPENGSGNEPKRAVEPPTHFGGVDRASKWEPENVAESPRFYSPSFARKEIKPSDWVSTGVPIALGHVKTSKDNADAPKRAADSLSFYGRVNTDWDTADTPTLDADLPAVFAPADPTTDTEIGEAETEDGQTGELQESLESLSSAPPEPESYAYYVESVEDERSPDKSLRVILMAAGAIFTIAALGFAIWITGFNNPTPPTTKLAQACDAGDAKACSNLAVWFEKTNTVTDGDSRAAGYYSKACDGALPQACRKLGLKYLLGNGVARDAPQAIQLFSKACDQGDYEGCDTLADIYHEGKGVKISDRKAAALYSKACAAGDQFGCSWARKLATATRPAKPTAKP
jgi:serine/threonine-protein kinase